MTPAYAGLVNRIRLAGGVPRFVSCTPGPDGWATDPGELAAAIGPRTAAVLLMSPVMPTGAVVGGEHFDAIAGPVSRHRAWVIWDAAMERIRFDGQRIDGKATEDIVRLGIAHAPEGRGTFVNLTVEENLRLGAYSRRDAAASAQELQRVYGYFPILADRRRQQKDLLTVTTNEPRAHNRKGPDHTGHHRAFSRQPPSIGAVSASKPRRTVLHHRRVAEDDREHVVKVVGEAAGQPSDCFHLLSLA